MSIITTSSINSSLSWSKVDDENLYTLDDETLQVAPYSFPQDEITEIYYGDIVIPANVPGISYSIPTMGYGLHGSIGEIITGGFSLGADLEGTSTVFINLQELNAIFLNHSIIKSFSKLKYIQIYNKSKTQPITIDNINSAPITFFSAKILGPRGNYSLLAKAGINLDDSNSCFTIRNLSGEDIEVQYIFMGDT